MRQPWSMRRWLVVTLATVAVVSFVAFFLLTFGLQLAGLLPVETVRPQVRLRERIMQEWRSWGDLRWQQSLAEDIAAAGWEVRLSDAGGNLLYQSTPMPLDVQAASSRSVTAGKATARTTQGRVEVLTVSEGGTPVGNVWLYESWDWPRQKGGIVWTQVGLILSILLTAVSVSSLAAVWLLRRVFLVPLRSLAAAAGQVLAGNLDFTLPAARVREVAEVLDAFAQMADGLHTAIARQAGMEEERRFFLAAVSHDLRTPLFALRGRLEGIRDGLANTPERLAHYLNSALRSIDGLDRLVADLFVYTRLDVLEQVPAKEQLELGAVVRRAVETVAPAADAKGIRLKLADPERTCPLAGDPHLLTRALGNLIDNAIRYTPPGGQVAVGWAADGEVSTAWVQDTGPGIPPELLSNLSTVLYRGDSHRPRSEGGAGLGLAIARRVAEAHGGTLAAANRESGGSRFTISFRTD